MTKGNIGDGKKLLTRREFLVGGGAVLAATAFVACSNKTTPMTTPATTPTTGSSTLPFKYGGVLKIISMPPTSIGLPAEMVVGGGEVMQVCMETLLRGDNKGNIIPWLAESYKVADDLKSITFNLRKGVKFHDGSDFNADAAKWNLDNMINARLEPNWSSVDIIDGYTIRVNFTDWVNTLLTSFGDTMSLASMVSKAAYDTKGEEWMRLNPVGTGPFKFVSFARDVNMKFTKNSDYWQKGKPYLDSLEHIFITDPVVQKLAMQAGEGNMVCPEVGKLTADYAKLGFTVKGAVWGNNCLMPDTANADSPWANQEVREAVEYAIDRDSIAKNLGYGYLQAPYQLPPRESVAYNPDFTLGRQYDPEKAKQLLAEAGYSDGFKTTIIMMPTLDQNIVIAAQADLAKIGIQVEVDYPDLGRWMGYVGPVGVWHNAALYMNMSAGDPYYAGGLQMIFNFLSGKSWLKTSEFTRAYQAALSSPSPDIKLINAVTDMITRDASIIPVSEGGSGRVQQPYVMAGFNERGTPKMWNAEDAWLNK